MRIGLVVNPIAGLGGPVGLKGTDGPGVIAAALARGAVPVAGRNAERFLRQLARFGARPELLVGAGAMGEDAARLAGQAAIVVGTAVRGPSSARDTKRIVAYILKLGIDLLLFSGGDGTARDILHVVRRRVPILGIPSGVKMYSAVFAASPEAAAAVVANFASVESSVQLRDAEVMDIDEEKVRFGRVSAQLFGYARVPFERRLVPGAKVASFGESAALAGAARDIVDTTELGVVQLIGPGTTMRQIKQRFGFEGTLLGVDGVINGRLVMEDVGEQQILELISGRKARIIVGITGGQGFVFGRGNQQFSAAVIRAVGRDRITIVASAEKLAALSGSLLRVDTGDPGLDLEFKGFVRVITGRGETAMMRIGVEPAPS